MACLVNLISPYDFTLLVHIQVFFSQTCVCVRARVCVGSAGTLGLRDRGRQLQQGRVWTVREGICCYCWMYARDELERDELDRGELDAIHSASIAQRYLSC